MEKPSLRQKESRLRCATCHDGGELETCPTCSTRFHAQCRADLKKCPTLGCAAQVSGVTLQWENGPTTFPLSVSWDGEYSVVHHGTSVMMHRAGPHMLHNTGPLPPFIAVDAYITIESYPDYEYRILSIQSSQWFTLSEPFAGPTGLTTIKPAKRIQPSISAREERDWRRVEVEAEEFRAFKQVAVAAIILAAIIGLVAAFVGGGYAALIVFLLILAGGGWILL